MAEIVFPRAWRGDGVADDVVSDITRDVAWWRWILRSGSSPRMRSGFMRASSYGPRISHSAILTDAAPVESLRLARGNPAPGNLLRQGGHGRSGEVAAVFRDDAEPDARLHHALYLPLWRTTTSMPPASGRSHWFPRASSRWRSRAKYRNAIHAGAAAIVLSLGVLTWQQCHIYLSGETIWRDTLEKNPGSLMAHFNLANQLEREGLAEASQTTIVRWKSTLTSIPGSTADLLVVMAAWRRPWLITRRA